jgi:hypothetical protein
MSKIAGFMELNHQKWQAAGSAQIFMRVPFTCEQVVPRDFAPGVEKTLVLKEERTVLYDLVGGPE